MKVQTYMYASILKFMSINSHISTSMDMYVWIYVAQKTECRNGKPRKRKQGNGKSEIGNGNAGDTCKY